MSFKQKKFKVLRKVVSSELIKFIYNYFLNKRKVSEFLFTQKFISPYTTYWGVWNDEQIPNTYAHYADIVMETLLQELKGRMEKESGYKLFETYTYARIYKTGDTLHRHKDRYSCEVSATLNLGGEEWPIYLDATGKTGQAGIKITLKPGDLLMYSGCDIEHWREAFPGKNCGQVFLHYNDAKKKSAKINKYDRRPFLGLPDYFQNFKSEPSKK